MKVHAFKEKLAQYITMSAAFLAAHAEKADAQIMYTDVIPDLVIHNSYFNLDLNNDGVADFKLQHESNAWSFYNSYSSGGGNSNSAINICLGFNKIVEITSDYSYNQIPAPLNYGDTINQFRLFGIESLLHFHSFFYPGGFNYDINNVVGIDKYIGLKVIKNSLVYYGWARLDVDDDKIVLKDYAINSFPDSTILAGETSMLCNIIPPIISPGSSELLCNSDSDTLNLLNATGLSIQWMKNGQWLNGENDTSIIISQAGNYKVLVSDSTCAIIIGGIQIDSLYFQLSENHINENCDLENGGINIFITGNSNGYNFNWSNGDTSQNLSNISAGNYELVVTSTVCPSNIESLIVTVNNLSGPMLTEIHSDSTCITGFINLSVVGGTPGYIYLWDDDSQSQDLNNLNPGNYIVTVTDVIGCTATTSILINSFPLPLITSAFTDSICNNNLGFIDVTITNGSPAINYIWSTGSTQEDLFNISAGNYILNVIDNNGCSSTDSFDIINFIPPIPTITEQNNTLFSSYSGKNQWYYYSISNPLFGDTLNYYVPTSFGNFFAEAIYNDSCTTFSNPFAFWFDGIINLVNPEVSYLISNKKITFQLLTNILFGNDIIICNQLGQQVSSTKIETENPVIDLSLAPTGIYFYHIRSKQKTFSGKFFIE